MDGYKTVVINLIMIAFGFLGPQFKDIPADQVNTVVTGCSAFAGVVNIALRWFTKSPIFQKPS